MRTFGIEYNSNPNKTYNSSSSIKNDLFAPGVGSVDEKSFCTYRIQLCGDVGMVKTLLSKKLFDEDIWYLKGNVLYLASNLSGNKTKSRLEAALSIFYPNKNGENTPVMCRLDFAVVENWKFSNWKNVEKLFSFEYSAYIEINGSSSYRLWDVFRLNKFVSISPKTMLRDGEAKIVHILRHASAQIECELSGASSCATMSLAIQYNKDGREAVYNVLSELYKLYTGKTKTADEYKEDIEVCEMQISNIM